MNKEEVMVKFYKILVTVVLATLICFAYGGYARALESITRVSTTSAGGEANDKSYGSSISGDGRYVAFYSTATNLGGSGPVDVYLKDATSGSIIGVAANVGVSQFYGPNSLDISNDGHYLAYMAFVGDNAQIYRYNIVTTATELASSKANGTAGDGSTMRPTISSDGRYVAFVSSDTDLVSGDTNDKNDIFVKDMQTGSVGRISIDSSGTQANDNSSDPSISADGRYVAFWSDASNLIDGDTNGTYDVFVHDNQTKNTTRVSTDASGSELVAGSAYPSISADGNFVAFQTEVPGLGYTSEIFIKDISGGTLNGVSTDSSSNSWGNNDSYRPVISNSGRYVIFGSIASNLIGTGNDTNGVEDIFLKDTQTDQTARLSTTSLGAQTVFSCLTPPSASNNYSISADGKYMSFASNANNLVSGDTNCDTDIFLRTDTSGPSIASITSSTPHSSNNYFSNASPVITVTGSDISGIGGYNFTVDHTAGTIPDSYIASASGTYHTGSLANGTWYLHARACDSFENWGSSANYRINIDTYHPKTYAPSKVTIHANHTAKLYWKVADSYTGGKATVTLKLQKKSGGHYKSYKTIGLGFTSIGTSKHYSYKLKSEGTYKLLVYATDQAGNTQGNVASNYVYVK